MDSINQQQPEENYKDLTGQEAGQKMQELTKDAETCHFCTKITTGQPLKARPMSIRKVDDDGNFWFLSASDSNKNADIESDSNVHLLLQSSAHSGFLSVFGVATISKDKQIINELWEPLLKTWFTEGLDDPRITAIKVEAKEGYYWDNKHGNMVAFAKMVAGAVLGKTLDDSIEGKLINP